MRNPGVLERLAVGYLGLGGSGWTAFTGGIEEVAGGGVIAFNARSVAVGAGESVGAVGVDGISLLIVPVVGAITPGLGSNSEGGLGVASAGGVFNVLSRLVCDLVLVVGGGEPSGRSCTRGASVHEDMTPIARADVKRMRAFMIF